MSNLHNSVENDFDSYFKFENDFTPISASPAGKNVAPSFVGPSYQYDSHRQQTGLPVGGLQNAFAINQASGLHYRPTSMGFVMPTETLNMPLDSSFDDLDFTRHQSIDMADMDFEADSPSDVTNMFYGQGESSQSAPVQRIYPGIHTQKAAQAAQAKAAQAQKQQELLKQRQQKALAGQQALPTQTPKAPAAKDPHVEETISNLLNQMRQRSSSSAEESTPLAMNGMGGLTRPKKEEDDMDDDERLLASEEGKKLSSKERRQLRNKVSARAFRSRRKEYIGQLEAEVQQKAQEANDLRVQNRQLLEENNRLTDLTRMLLSSASFSGFLQELSNSGAQLPSAAPANQPNAQSTQMRKDIPLHEAARQLQNQNQSTVGMAMIPETTLAMTDNWSSLPSNDFQVFSVTAVPQPLLFDMSALQEKPAVEQSSPVEVNFTSDDAEAVEGSDDLYCEVQMNEPVPVQTAQALIASLRKPDQPSQTLTLSASTDVYTLPTQLEGLCKEMERGVERLAKLMPSAKD